MTRFAALTVLLSALGCGHRSAPPAMPPPKVLVSQPMVQPDFVDRVEFTGRTEAVETVEVRARVEAFIDKVLFTDGDEVQEKQQLYQLDPRTFQAEVDRAAGEVKRLEADVDLAITEEARAKRLLGKGGAASREEYDQRVATLKKARAQLETAKAQLESARLQLSFTRIDAPIGGQISRTLLTAGNLVGGSGERTLLTTIVRQDPMFVYFDASEQGLLEYQKLQRAKAAGSSRDKNLPAFIGVGLGNDYPFKGIIDFQDNRVDPTTGTIRLRAVVPNPVPAMGGPRFLRPGLFARVQVPVGQPHEALLMVDRAINRDQDVKFVYVINDANEAEYRKVELGPISNGLRVILSGVQKGEWVVTAGAQKLKPGAQVIPDRQPLPQPPKTQAKASSAFGILLDTPEKNPPKKD